MSIESNLHLVRNWVEQIWNQAHPDRPSEFHPSTFQNRGHPTTLEEARQWHLHMRATFPDLQYVIQDIFATEERVAMRWPATATQHGESDR